MSPRCVPAPRAGGQADIEKAKKEGVAPKAAAAPAGTALAKGLGREQVVAMYEEGTYDLVPADGMRKTVAARLTESKQTVPHFYLTLDCRIDDLMKARENINNAAPKDKDGKPAYKLSVNDFIMKAWALALQQVPQANARGRDAILSPPSDVGVIAVPATVRRS